MDKKFEVLNKDFEKLILKGKIIFLFHQNIKISVIWTGFCLTQSIPFTGNYHNKICGFKSLNEYLVKDLTGNVK